MQGFQLWLNLPAADKMIEPWYRDFPASQLPRFSTSDGVQAVVIAGRSHGVTGAVERPVTDPVYLDLQFSGPASFAQSLPSGHNAFIAVHEGSIQVGDQTVRAGQLAILDNEANADGVILLAQRESRALLIAGAPLNEPIVQYGPFVMNTEDQVRQALSDFRAGRF